MCLYYMCSAGSHHCFLSITFVKIYTAFLKCTCTAEEDWINNAAVSLIYSLRNTHACTHLFTYKCSLSAAMNRSFAVFQAANLQMSQTWSFTYIIVLLFIIVALTCYCDVSRCHSTAALNSRQENRPSLHHHKCHTQTKVSCVQKRLNITACVYVLY